MADMEDGPEGMPSTLPKTKTNRGLGSQVKALAQATRTGGIGKTVSAMAKARSRRKSK